MTSPSELTVRRPAASPLAASLPALAFLALCFIWGSTYLAIRVAVQTVPPLLMVGTRSVIAGAIMLAAARIGGAAWPDRSGLRNAALAGVLLFLGGQALLAFGEQRVPSGQAAVLGAMLTLFMPLASWCLRDSPPPGRRTILALLTGFAGVAVLVRPGAGVVNPVGGAIVLASVFLWGLGGAVSRKWLATRSVPMTSGLQMLAGGAACLLLSALTGEAGQFAPASVSAHSAAAFLYLILFGSFIGFTAFAWLVRIWPPERVSTYTYVNPIVALMLGAWLAGERLSPREGVATLLILGAVAVVMIGSPRKR